MPNAKYQTYVPSRFGEGSYFINSVVIATLVLLGIIFFGKDSCKTLLKFYSNWSEGIGDVCLKKKVDDEQTDGLKWTKEKS